LSNSQNSLFQNLNQNCDIYVNSIYQSATLPPELNDAVVTYNANLIYVVDFTKPLDITDLSDSNVTSTTVDLNFTPPTSTNALDFYEVWVERLDLGTWEEDRVKGRYNINQEITSSGDTITGLLANTTYRIRVVACDIYWNRSEFSNQITITTL
jgi:hypothetical protein